MKMAERAAAAVLLVLTLQTAHACVVNSTYLYFYESPLSLNASLGSSAVFQCEVYDWYRYYSEFSTFWLVRNSTSGYNFSFQNSSGEIIIDGYCWGPYYCYTFLKIPASDFNNNTEIQCQASFDICPDDFQSSSIATLHIQGSLAAPSDLQQQVSVDDGELLLNWTAPFTLAGVPILQYTIYVRDYTTGEEYTINTTATEYTLSKPHVQCGVEVSVSAWNAVGEGEKSDPLFYYTREDTLVDAVVSVVDSAPDVLCIACSFMNDSNARGCHVTLSEEGSDNPQQTTPSLTIFRDMSMSSSTVFLDCLTGLQGKNYSVVVREMKCDGKLAKRTFIWQAIPIGGKPQNVNVEFDPNATKTSTSKPTGAVIGLAAIVALLAAALIVAVVVIMMLLCTKKRNGKSVDTPPLDASSSPLDTEGKELTYDNPYESIELNPTSAAQLSVSTNTATIHTEECAAYGVVGRQN